MNVQPFIRTTCYVSETYPCQNIDKAAHKMDMEMELPQLMVMCVIRMESCIRITNFALINKLFLNLQMETLKLKISKKVIPGFRLRRFYLNLFKRMLNYNIFFP